MEKSGPKSQPWSFSQQKHNYLLEHPWNGSGTENDPFIVNFTEDDSENPKTFQTRTKWIYTAVMAFATLSVTLTSSAYSGGSIQIKEQFGCTDEENTLGVSLFVLGFALGPVLWAPLSEFAGRRLLFIVTFGAFVVFNAAATGARNIETLLVVRFLAGAFGSSPLSNAGGVISDMFDPGERGPASTLYAAAPSLGPVLGPIFSGFTGEAIGWKWIFGICTIFSAVLFVLGSMVPETYTPFLLQRRARQLAKATGKSYVSILENNSKAEKKASTAFKTSLARPWQLLLREPIVLLLSTYLAVAYGTLYLTFSAFPIMFQQARGWSQGINGLSFVGLGIGQGLGAAYYIWDNRRFIEVVRRSEGGIAPPEARLPPCMTAAFFLPIGLIWLAWTNSPSIHWIIPILATVPFGCGLLILFLTTINYLMDAYTVYAASVMAANTILRSLFGFAFPMFTRQMYGALGLHWATMIPAFLTLLCFPFPFLFYRYGSGIRSRCKYASHADEIMKEIRRAEATRAGGEN